MKTLTGLLLCAICVSERSNTWRVLLLHDILIDRMDFQDLSAISLMQMAYKDPDVSIRQFRLAYWMGLLYTGTEVRLGFSLHKDARVSMFALVLDVSIYMTGKMCRVDYFGVWLLISFLHRGLASFGKSMLWVRLMNFLRGESERVSKSEVSGSPTPLVPIWDFLELCLTCLCSSRFLRFFSLGDYTTGLQFKEEKKQSKLTSETCVLWSIGEQRLALLGLSHRNSQNSLPRKQVQAGFWFSGLGGFSFLLCFPFLVISFSVIACWSLMMPVGCMQQHRSRVSPEC